MTTLPITHKIPLVSASGQQSLLSKNICQHPLYQRKDNGFESKKNQFFETHNAEGWHWLPPFSVGADNIREVLQLLKRKPEGIKITKELLETHKRILEIKKIAAYEKLGLITRENYLINLSTLGWKFVEQLRAEAMIFRTLLRINPEYQAALIWMAECQKELITVDDVSEQWYQRLDATNDRNHGRQNLDCLRDSAVTFFHLCQAADLGSMTLGKRGRTTRLFIDRDELVKFVSQYFKESDRDIDETFESDSTADDPWPLTALENEFFVTEKVRDVLLIDNGNQVVTDQIKAAFELAGLSHLMIVEDKEQGRIRFDRKSYRAFNSTSLGCLVIGENEAERDPKTLQWRLKDTVLYEIGAAAFGLRSRLILVSTVKLKMPKVLNEIPLFQLQSGHLSWEIALQIVDKIKSIKKLEGES